MELSAQDFPPLSSPSLMGQPPVLPSGSYAENLSAPAAKTTSFPMSFFSPAPKLSFRANYWDASIWNLSLLGYSIGPRPYYERLLAAMKKIWSIKGISRIASYIGVPISVDSLTANRTRLTFARTPIPDIPVKVPPALPTSSPAKDHPLPNLNFPLDDASCSELPSPSSRLLPTNVPITNMFASLQTEENEPPPQDPPREDDLPDHSLSQTQTSTDCSSSDQHLSSKVKTKSPKETKKGKPKTLIHGTFLAGSAPSIQVSVVYASNNVIDRQKLWDDLRNVAPPLDHPWIIMGDFNCYRFDYEKAGGNPPSQSSLGELNKCIFYCGVQDLASVGLFYTWFNQRIDMPIHIKLDRILLNSFWDEVILAFSRPLDRSPISDFYQSLRILKNALKGKNWSSSNFLSKAILDVKNSQSRCLYDLQSNPLCQDLNSTLKGINKQLAFLQSAWSSWMSQCAKAYWLTKEEDDMGFLFAKIKVRKNRNILREITTEQGYFSSQSAMAEAIINHFSSLFNSPNTVVWDVDSIPVGKLVPTEMQSFLLAPVTDVEIKKVVFSGKTDAAPGPDGFSFEFYRKTWHLPISLCNVFYKVVAKLLANKLKEVLPLIIHDNQVGFIAKRCSSDDIILAADLLREFKVGSNLFCAKLNIWKAFDSLSRDFLLHRLRMKGFPEPFIKWIKGCISDVYFSVCINGSLEGFFKSSSGLRQGCPLSPLLFCIAMDGLSCCLQPNLFKGISCNGMTVNHLLYADDLLVFGKAEEDNVLILLNALNCFAKASNLCVNPTKSSILFAKDVNSSYIITDLLGIHQSSSFLTYLGLLISPSRLKFSHFQPLLSRVSALLAGWKVKFLSFAGRLQFLKFTIANTIAYWIRGAIIPKSCAIYSDARLSFANVGNFIINDGWFLPDFLPPDVKEAILDIHIMKKPALMWEGSCIPSFKQFTNHFYSSLENVQWHDFIWHKRSSLKFACFTWMALIGKLKCADILIRKGINVIADCAFCKSHRESHHHLFFECDFTFTVLVLVLPLFQSFLLRPNLLMAVEFLDSSIIFASFEKNLCFSIMACTVYHIWRERNNRRFSNAWQSPVTVADGIKAIIRKKVKSWKNVDQLKQIYSSIF
ncbi:hypothetical protein KFK09_012346 [Dendrobium nobile]|uniref:Reverse transcriptase domain-containing protein n=1 Tax=Dendrobium nobile TaxID=94219 RepID=A0A8T3BH52_DENNO|nr:hypothetical protein KFK09_012346 [Dendrobium nobile]